MTSYTLVPVRETYIYADGSPKKGFLEFAVGQRLLTTDGATIAAQGSTYIPLVAGSLTTQLLATDDPALQQTGWTYTVIEHLQDGTGLTFPLSVPIAAAGLGITLGAASTGGGGGGSTGLVGLGILLDAVGPYADSTVTSGGLGILVDSSGIVYLDTAVTSSAAGIQIDGTTGALYATV